jgi:hypothetical protein
VVRGGCGRGEGEGALVGDGGGAGYAGEWWGWDKHRLVGSGEDVMASRGLREIEVRILVGTNYEVF